MVKWLSPEERRQAQLRQLEARERAVAAGAPGLARFMAGVNAELEAKANPPRLGVPKPRDFEAELAAARRGKNLSKAVGVLREQAAAHVEEQAKPKRLARTESGSDPLVVEKAIRHVESLSPEQRQTLHTSEWFVGLSRPMRDAYFDALGQVEIADEAAGQAFEDAFDEAADADDFYTPQEEEAI